MAQHPDILDLDVLRPTPKLVKLAGHEIDVSFVPCGITFELNDLMTQATGLDMKEVEKGGAQAKEGFDLALQMCALFCSIEHPELDTQWFRAHTSPVQICALAEVIKDTLMSSLEGVEGYQKNFPGSKRTGKRT